MYPYTFLQRKTLQFCHIQNRKKTKEIGQTFCCNLTSASVKAIWDMFHTMREKSQKKTFPKYDQVQNGILHVMVAALFEVQNYFFLSDSFVFYPFLKCSMSHTSFSSLAAHFVTTVLICFSLKAKTNTSKTHSLAADVTISPSFPQSHHLYTSPQLSTDIRALWSTDALVLKFGFRV